MKLFKVAPVLMLTVLSLSLLSACGKAKFQPLQKQEQSVVAVAGQYTKIKVDIVIFQDNSDSMTNSLQYIKPQLVKFLNDLDSRWDYHFTVLPLLYRGYMQNKFTAAPDCATAGVANCLSASQFQQASGDYGWINSNVRNGSNDFGLEYMRQNLTDAGMSSSGFLRPDAALASIVVSDGNDISTVSYTQNAGGQTVIDQQATQAGLSTYVNFLKNLKPAAIMSKFYAVVVPGSANDLRNCYGSQVFAGSSYSFVANALGLQNGLAFDVCSGSALTGVLNHVGTQLTALIEAYQFNLVALTEKPDPATIKVFKNGAAIPQSNVNGWSYDPIANANPQTLPTSFLPAPSNIRTGYMIKLNGTAIYKGTDKIDVKYKAL